MRIRFIAHLSGLLILVLAPAAGAATLSFTGTLGFQVGGSAFPIGPVELSGSGVATVNGSGGGVHLSSLAIPAAAFVGNPSVAIYNAAPISGLLLAGSFSLSPHHIATGPIASSTITYYNVTGSASNAAGAFANLSNSANNFAGVMPLSGIAVLCLFQPCSSLLNYNLIVPLSVVGQGGTATAIGARITFTAFGAPWFKNTATLVGAAFTSTVMGFAHGPASATQSTTAQPGGVLSLVTPVFLSTTVQTLSEIPLFGRVTLHFVPEPSTLLLQGVAVAVLSVIARRKYPTTWPDPQEIARLKRLYGWESTESGAARSPRSLPTQNAPRSKIETQPPAK